MAGRIYQGPQRLVWSREAEAGRDSKVDIIDRVGVPEFCVHEKLLSLFR